MTDNDKLFVSPASTGGLGHRFENCVQASFVVLMITGGVSPCLPNWPIHKIILQGRCHDYKTDDLIVFTQRTSDKKESKLIGQIKHSIKFTKNQDFQDVIQSAWVDFNNQQKFNGDNDLIALITGPLSATDTNDVRALLRQAEEASSVDNFIQRIELGKFISKQQYKKYNFIKDALKKANKDSELTEEQLWRFLKCYRLLIYDLDIKGVTFSLLNSLIGQCSQDNADTLWCQIKDFVGEKNERAGEITLESIPDDIITAFERKPQKTIPSELSKPPSLKAELQFAFEGKPTETISPELSKLPLLQEEMDWNQSQHASELAVANFIGAWYERSEADIVIVSQLAKVDYSTWISKIREVIQQPNTPITFKDGIWSVDERKKLWKALGSRLFDENLDVFKQCVVEVLTEVNPMYDLPPEDRFAATIHGKVLQHSQHLRKGLSESLALLGSHPGALTRFSTNKPETIALLAVRKIFENADWKLWGSLNDLLPLFAEAAPNEFLNIVERTLQQTPCPFDELFSQEGSGFTGGNYLTGLLWALEILAWDEQFLVRASVILGELASHDPGGNWVNRPSNSLTTIFLPWLPQTTASIEKRQVAVKTIIKEVPEIAWKLLLKLLPNQYSSSSGSRKPIWRDTIPEEWKKEVTKGEYWEQASFYADLAFEMAKHDISKLEELIGYLDNLPEPYFDKILEHLSSEDILSRPEHERLGLWVKLTEFASGHKRYVNKKSALSSDIISRIDDIANAIVPTDPMNLHQRLFSGCEHGFYEEIGSWQEQQKQLEEDRQKAIKDIIEYAGINAVLKFAEIVKLPSNIGRSLGIIAEPKIDDAILPKLLEAEQKNLVQLAGGYIWGRHYSQEWTWVDKIDTSDWSVFQIGQFLGYLPFMAETWTRVKALLNDSENEYWDTVNVNPYQAGDELLFAIDKLIEYGRPRATIQCLFKILYDGGKLDQAHTVQALISAASSSEPSHTMDAYHITEIIKALQKAPDANPEDLFKVEWAYLPLLDGHRGTLPKFLENRLASDPDFFCEVIRIIYRSKNEPETDKELTEQKKDIASNAWKLLHEWKTPPGMDSNRAFSESRFKTWLKSVKDSCIESGHLEVAFLSVGNVLIHTPRDSDGLWINKAVADALNCKDADELRNGFRLGIVNSRGVHIVNPTGKPEKELATKYRKQAEEVENAGYQRFAVTLNDIAKSYDREAKRNISDHETEDFE